MDFACVNYAIRYKFGTANDYSVNYKRASDSEIVTEMKQVWEGLVIMDQVRTRRASAYAAYSTHNTTPRAPSQGMDKPMLDIYCRRLLFRWTSNHGALNKKKLAVLLFLNESKHAIQIHDPTLHLGQVGTCLVCVLGLCACRFVGARHNSPTSSRPSRF